MKRDVSLQADGLKIAGQLYLPEDAYAPYPAVILCHGVPSGVVDPTDGGYPLLAETISEEGLAVLIFSFRGAGASEGNFDITGWTHDLKAAIDYLCDLAEIDKTRISLVGYSAGAAVSIYVAARDKRISAVAACACPAEFTAISGPQPKYTLEHYRQIGIIRDPDFPPSPEEGINGFRRISALRSVSDIAPRPLLLIHGTKDNVVPVDDSERLYEKAGEPRQIVIIEGAEHKLRRNEIAVETVINWLKAKLN
jgi:dipeptidyl aminopeptidase/acylaminoacyl peptidase